MTDLNINPETGASETTGRSPRLTLWIAFLVFSTVALGASVEVKKEEDDPSSAAKWAMACTVMSFVLTLLVVVAHLIPITATMFVGTFLEGIMSLVMICFWAATVSIVTNASNGLSVTDNFSFSNTITNANLYYFSWSSFVTSIVIMVDYLKSAFGLDLVDDLRNRSARLTLWAGLLAASLVVMGSSARVWSQSCVIDETLMATEFCKRTKFGIALGATTVFLSVLIVAIKLCLTASSFLVEFVVGFILAIMNAFGVAYITSASGPGAAIGNLYYFSWISFLSSAFLTANCFEQFKNGDAAPGGNNDDSSPKTASSSPTGSSNGDLVVEDLQDNI